MELDSILIQAGEYQITIVTPNKRIPIGRAYRLEDGYYAFRFAETFYTEGFWTNEFFGLINNKLQELNREWDMQVRKDLEN